MNGARRGLCGEDEALESAAVVFIAEDGGGAGVRLKGKIATAVLMTGWGVASLKFK
jgi:hypothetical protein